MRNKCNLNERNLSIGLCSFNNNNILNQNISQTSILNNNNTLRKGGVGPLEVEDNNQEESLVKEEAKLYAIIVENQDIFSILSKSCKKLYIL